jgi:hypothetical protein
MYEGSVFPTASPTFVVVGVLMIAILRRIRCNIIVVLIHLAFTTRDGKHFFMCFLAIWISSFEKVLFSSVAHFFIGSVIFGRLVFMSYLYILVISPLSEVKVANIFSYFMGGLFNLETISFVVQKDFNFI